MKNITLLSLVAAALLFTACGDKTKKAASDATDKVTEAVKADTTSAVESTQKAAADAVEAAKAKVAEVADATAAKAAEVKKATEDKAAEAAQALKDRAAAATAAVSATATSAVASAKAAVTDNAAGKATFAKCAGCHGANGKTKALGKSAVIAGEAAADLESKLAAYKAGTRNVAGMGMLMKGQVASLSDEDIKAVAAYISSL